MRILITGGAGFIPSSLADKLIEMKSEVVLVDNFVTGKRENIPPEASFFEVDVNQHDKIAPIFRKYSFDYVFHFAALVGVKRTLENPLKVLEDIQGIKNVLALSNETNVKRVFYSSSSEVYGEPVHLPQHEETTPLNSRLPYAIVKNVGESFFKSYQQTYGLDYTIFRFFNTYGPKQSSDFVMSKFIRAALTNQDITIYGDGSQTRTFCYVNDNIDACVQAMLDVNSINQVFNIGNDVITTIKDLAETIIEVCNSNSQIIYLPPLEDGDMTRRQPDISKMRKLINRDLIELETGIKKVINEIKSK
ncbi:MAG: NAD-dependent epimerase/dehydratase family protein [Fluviicola sp.]|nr:NAD-dependent epimerase/dehydratase family protein [Fluviicola sp.]